MEFEDIVFAGRRTQRPISPYVYSQLDHRRNEFRLIRLHLSAAQSAAIEVTLEHYSLLDPPEFVALSYEWGHPGEYAFIHMNGVSVPVTRNLHLALQQLRDHRWTLLWVDALCINQRSEEERSAQILRMAAIYQEAQRVGVWLGPEFEGSGKVMRFLRSLYNAIQTGDSSFMESASRMTGSKRTELQAFFDRSYWTRVWIIQEIVVGSQVSILCGRDVLEWEELNEAILSPLFKHWEQHLHLRECHNLCKIRSKDVLGASTSLLEALHASSLSQSTEPKDKVFGLLGLAFDKRVYLTEPQYGWGDLELCMRMTKSFIARKRSLDIIFIGSKHSVQYTEPVWTRQLPSWCPNYIHFPSTPRLKQLISYVSGQDERVRTGTFGRRWLSTGSSVATLATFRITMHYLQVKALPIGHISALANIVGETVSSRYVDNYGRGGETTSMETATGNAVSRMLFLLYNKDYDRHIVSKGQNSKAFRGLLFHFDSTTLAHEKLARQFDEIKMWRYLNKDFSILGNTLKGRCADYKPLIGAHFKPMSVLPTGAIYFGLMKSVQSQAESYRMPSLDIQGSLSALADLIAEGLRLMTTSQRNVGWAHPDAELRDEIFLIPGCSMPAILRRQDGSPDAYTVVGHAYVDGYMDGEFWKSVNLSHQRLQDICLV
jgi:hypothetical protein